MTDTTLAISTQTTQMHGLCLYARVKTGRKASNGVKLYPAKTDRGIVSQLTRIPLDHPYRRNIAQAFVAWCVGCDIDRLCDAGSSDSSSYLKQHDWAQLQSALQRVQSVLAKIGY